MAENSRFGREPIQVVQIDQDFCSRTFGDPTTGCAAGNNMNLFENTTDLESSPAWGSRAFFNTYGLGPDGLSQSIILYSDDGIGSPGTYSGFISSTGSGPAQSATIPVAKWSFLARKVSGSVSSARIRTRVNVAEYDGLGGDVSDWGVCNPADGTVSGPLIASSEDVGGGFYRFYFEYQSVVSRSEYEFFVDFAIENGLDETLEWTMPSCSFGDFFPYIRTTGSPVYPIAGENCFNTRSTCLAPSTYDKTVLPLKFVNKQAVLPKDDYYIPSLTNVKVTPARLNPGGANRNAGALGERASISVSFRDHPHSDRLVDKYRTERSYNPEERGTFWTKWRARNPYYMQRPITLTTGYLKDGAIVDPITREFVITGFTGPDSNGNVTIKGKDVLTLAEDEKAQAPVASSGKLNADITAGATSATLTPSGIGNIEYPASGFVRIGKEVMSFTRSGDTLTITRGQFGTEATEHDADDTVQLCLRYTSEAPQDILYDLLLNYANIPASYLDKAQWDSEALDFLPRLYTAIITEPVGVSKLISEMAQQMYFTVWWDERLGKVIMKAVRLAQEDEVYELDDDKHLIADSIGWKDLADELITQVWVYYGQIDPTEKIDQGSNYSTISITADPTAEGPDKHNLRRIKTIFSRWIDATNASAAEDLGSRILNRYGNAPREVTFRVDAKDDYLWLGDYIRLTNRLRVDRFGTPVPVNLQIFEAEEASLGSEYRFTAQEFIPALIGDEGVENPNERVIPITSDLLNVNLRTLHDSLFGAPAGTETITFIVREGVTIGGFTAGGGVNVPYDQRVTTNDVYAAGPSSISGESMGNVPILQRASIGSPRTINQGDPYESLGDAAYIIKEYPISTALTTGSWPVGVTLKLVVEAGAKIIGEGGNGSSHVVDNGALVGVDVSGTDRYLFGVPGGDGGHALDIQYDIEITNGGVIAAGGAGGGSSAYVQFENAGVYRVDYAFGGGAAGLEISDTKETTSQFNDNPTRISVLSVRDASVGSETAGGIGGLHDLKFTTGLTPSEPVRAYKLGGSGGALASSGGSGIVRIYAQDGSISSQYTISSGGISGDAIASGANLIEWINKGDVRGDEVA